MRSFATLTLGLAVGLTAAAAHADPAVEATTAPETAPLWDAELRLGYGVSLGGGQGMATTKTSPLTISAIGAYALSYEPPLSGFAGLVVETLDRTAVGGTAGIRFTPMMRRLRLTAGGTAMIAPYTLYGATAGAGTCVRFGSEGLKACGDLQVTAYFAGDDLAPGHAVTQIQLVLGVGFDGS